MLKEVNRTFLKQILNKCHLKYFPPNLIIQIYNYITLLPTGGSIPKIQGQKNRKGTSSL